MAEISSNNTRGGVVGRSKISSSAIDDFRKDIILGNLAAGTNVTEQALCDKYGISRSPVRAMFQQLEKEGMVTILENGCKRIVGFSEKDVKDLFEFRLYIESTAVKKAAGKSTRNIAPLLQALSLAENSTEDKRILCPKIDFDFHRALVLASEDRYLIAAYDSVEPTLRTLFSMHLEVIDDDYYESFYRNHVVFLPSLMTGNVENCVELVRRHLVSSEREMVETIKKLGRHD